MTTEVIAVTAATAHKSSDLQKQMANGLENHYKLKKSWN